MSLLRRSLFAIAAGALVIAGAGGCAFDSSALNGPGVLPLDGAVADVPAPDGEAADGPAQHDGGVDGPPPSCVEGSAVCSGEVLLRCTGGHLQQETVCPLSCKPDEARCYRFAAANVADGDLSHGTGDLVIDGDQVLDLHLGLLEGGALPPGVSWHLEDQPGSNLPALAVIRVRDLIINEAGRLTVTGAEAAVILASRTIAIDGVLDAAGRGRDPGPGGWAGGARDAAGGGPGGGPAAANSGGDDSGGGGGGGGLSGGAGAKGGNAAAVAGGAGASDRTLAPLFGGSGGGGGGGDGNDGGGGGGAVQLSAAVSISVAGAILTGGGGGGRGVASFSNTGSGSGGGGGGAVLLEAPTIAVHGVIAAGGGGGGGAGCWTGTDGSDGEDA
ncbi:MAG TPA: hypothetical protein VGQ83_07480, partial [Polyangia bacterium]